MKYFAQLHNLPIFDLHAELDRLVSTETIQWDHTNQICLNHVEIDSTDTGFGAGSLTHDWNNSYTVTTESGTEKLIVPEREKPLQEEDFQYLCSVFKRTLFEEVYQELSAKYRLGRVRIMKSEPKTCLSWHVDFTPRIHYPIKTQSGCFMVIENEVMHLPQNTWWHTNTLPYHTAFNASLESRIHLVAVASA